MAGPSRDHFPGTPPPTHEGPALPPVAAEFGANGGQTLADIREKAFKLAREWESTQAGIMPANLEMIFQTSAKIESYLRFGYTPSGKEKGK